LKLQWVFGISLEDYSSFSEAKVKFFNNRNIGHVSDSEFIELQVKAHNDEMKKWF
jgi:hypothetical protein